MRRPAILTLTTDFGHEGPYVAAMKGVVLGLVPEARLVDVSHAIAPQDVLGGAFVLAGVVDAFPAGTVHLAVVDPGVGTERRLIAALASDQWFVLPDNGLLTGVALGCEPEGVWEITNPAIRRAVVSATFHGRDVLAPAAAHLLLGRDPAELGPLRPSFIRLRGFRAVEDEHGLDGEVVFRDSFGNLVTNVTSGQLAAVPPDGWVVEVAGERVEGIMRTYGERSPGDLIALIGSTGWLELAVVNGDAARRLCAGRGTAVRVSRVKKKGEPGVGA